VGDVSVAVEPVGESVGAWWLRGRWSGQLPLRVLWGRFWVSLPVPEVGQVGLPLASKAPVFNGVLDSFPSSLASPLPSNFSPPRKKRITLFFIIEFSYYYLLLNLIFSLGGEKQTSDFPRGGNGSFILCF
jgi:hypothetical protein